MVQLNQDGFAQCAYRRIIYSLICLSILDNDLLLIFFNNANNIEFLKANLLKGKTTIIKNPTHKNHVFPLYIVRS